MGDVVTALGRAVQDEGHDVMVVLPKYDVLKYAEVMHLKQTGDFWHADAQVNVWEATIEGARNGSSLYPHLGRPELCAVNTDL